MVVVGADVHKRTHTFVAVDEVGRKVGEKVVRGNRQLNTALHRIAVTQIRLDGLGQAYYRKRLAASDSKTEALRCLKRRLARVVFHHLHTDLQNRDQPCQTAAA